MAKDDDEDERRKRRREREDESDNSKQTSKVPSPKGGISKTVEQHPSGMSFEDLIIKAEAQIDQLSALYNMYFAGADTLPPIERRAQLEVVMHTLQSAHKPTPAANFRFQSTLSRFNTYRERWDKQLKGLESGKLKRSPPKF